MCSLNISLVTVAKSSIIPGFKISVLGTYELNTLSLIHPNKEKKKKLSEMVKSDEHGWWS